ncbi:MAG TPA: acyltransferase [Ornithinibacter sp.]|nr:acyltransferase [Ornithinibacter sp.]
MSRPAIPPPFRRQFGGLNGVRGLGALFVLTTHVGFHSGAALNSTFNGLLSRLDVGVAIFFVISGFLLFRPHAEAWIRQDERPSTRSYLWHRALRILPALWLAIIAAALLLEQPEEALQVYARHATLTQIYGSGLAAQGLTQMWSLATEAAFYLLLPAIAWLLTRAHATPGSVRNGLLVLLSTPLLGAAWMGFTAWHPEGQQALWLPGYIGWFGLGMALALWRSGRAGGVVGASWVDDVATHPGTVWGLAVALFLVLISPVAGPYSLTQASPGQAVVKSVLYAVVAALVVLPCVVMPSDGHDPPSVRLLGGRTARFLGDISYGIFCYHLIVLGVVERAMGYEIFSGGFFRIYVPTLAVTCVVAAVSYYAVERPVMRRGRQGQRRTGVTNSPEASTATATAVNTIT